MIKFQIRPPSPVRNLSEGEVAAVDKDIVDLLKKGAIEVCLHTLRESVSNIFMIPKKSGRNRPVIDMRALNEFVEYILFRMKDISLLKSVLKQGDFMTKLDLRDAYLTVRADKIPRIYLRFVWRGVLYPSHQGNTEGFHTMPLTLETPLHIRAIQRDFIRP